MAKSNSIDEQPKKTKEKKEYVNNAELLKQIYISRERGELTKEALLMFMKIAEKIVSMRPYVVPEIKDDCIQQAMLDCLMYWKSFNPDKYEKPNPFSYYTSMISNGIIKGWNALHPESKKAKGCIFTSLDNNIYSI